MRACGSRAAARPAARRALSALLLLSALGGAQVRCGLRRAYHTAAA